MRSRFAWYAGRAAGSIALATLTVPRPKRWFRAANALISRSEGRLSGAPDVEPVGRRARGGRCPGITTLPALGPPDVSDEAGHQGSY